MIKVLLVDDETLVRTGLRLLLDGAGDTSRGGGIRVVGEAGDGRGALAEIARQRPDVVLMDIRMPGMHGLEALRELQGQADAPAVMMLTAFDTREDIIEALDGGARGFLRKVASPEALVAAVETVAAGQTAFSPDVVAHLLERSRGGTESGPGESSVLSDRENMVAELVSQGMTNEQIGQSLHLALPTVKSYMSRIMEKLGATNRVQVAVAYLAR